MVFLWVYKDSKIGVHARGPQDLLWRNSFCGDGGPWLRGSQLGRPEPHSALILCGGRLPK